MLKDVRIKKGISQSELANATGLNIRNIRAYEQGTRGISGAKLKTLLDICNFLDCQLEDIIDDPDTTTSLHKYKARSN